MLKTSWSVIICMLLAACAPLAVVVMWERGAIRAAETETSVGTASLGETSAWYHLRRWDLTLAFDSRIYDPRTIDHALAFPDAYGMGVTPAYAIVAHQLHDRLQRWAFSCGLGLCAGVGATLLFVGARARRWPMKSARAGAVVGVAMGLLGGGAAAFVSFPRGVQLDTLQFEMLLWGVIHAVIFIAVAMASKELACFVGYIDRRASAMRRASTIAHDYWPLAAVVLLSGLAWLGVEQVYDSGMRVAWRNRVFFPVVAWLRVGSIQAYAVSMQDNMHKVYVHRLRPIRLRAGSEVAVYVPDVHGVDGSPTIGTPVSAWLTWSVDGRLLQERSGVFSPSYATPVNATPMNLPVLQLRGGVIQTDRLTGNFFWSQLPQSILTMPVTVWAPSDLRVDHADAWDASTLELLARAAALVESRTGPVRLDEADIK